MCLTIFLSLVWSEKVSRKLSQISWFQKEKKKKGKVLAMHGGIGPNVETIAQISQGIKNPEKKKKKHLFDFGVVLFSSETFGERSAYERRRCVAEFGGTRFAVVRSRTKLRFRQKS
jgi:hypothetical protein